MDIVEDSKNLWTIRLARVPWIMVASRHNMFTECGVGWLQSKILRLDLRNYGNKDSWLDKDTGKYANR